MSKRQRKKLAELDKSMSRIDKVKETEPECETSLNELKDKFYLERVAESDKIGRKKQEK